MTNSSAKTKSPAAVSDGAADPAGADAVHGVRKPAPKRPGNVRLALMLAAVALAFYVGFFLVVSQS